MYLISFSFPIGLQAILYHMRLFRFSSILFDLQLLLSLLNKLIACQLMLNILC
jgi:hypothetical protein